MAWVDEDRGVIHALGVADEEVSTAPKAVLVVDSQMVRGKSELL